jgi:hypothetical protein
MSIVIWGITLPCVGPLLNFRYFLTTPQQNEVSHRKPLKIAMCDMRTIAVGQGRGKGPTHFLGPWVLGAWVFASSLAGSRRAVPPAGRGKIGTIAFTCTNCDRLGHRWVASVGWLNDSTMVWRDIFP